MLYYKQESYAIIGACMEVYNVLGPGFLENVYTEALQVEFGLRGIPYEKENRLNIIYKGTPLMKTFRADFLCYDDIIIEVKAVKQIDPIYQAVVINYLRASGKLLGLLVNFGEDYLHYERLVRNTKETS